MGQTHASRTASLFDKCEMAVAFHVPVSTLLPFRGDAVMTTCQRNFEQTAVPTML
jgi:hypothetical protein